MADNGNLMSPRMRVLADAVSAGESGVIEAFWAEMAAAGTPLIEPDVDNPALCTVTFLWRATEPVENVVVVEWITGGDLPDKRMLRLGETDVWYRSLRVRSDVRSVYRFSPNDSLTPRKQEADWPARMANFVHDPLNPRRFMEGAPLSPEDRPWVAGSIVELPDAPSYAWVEPRAGVPTGSVEKHRLRSEILENDRDVWLYQPSPFAAKGQTPGLLVLFDGERSLHVLQAAEQLDRLIAEGAIKPLVMAIVGNVDRGAELPCNPAFAGFLADELAPWMRSRCSISSDPRDAILAGQSYGGLAAVFGALERPDVFGNALSQSGSFWWKPDPFSTAEVAHGEAPEYAWLPRQVATKPAASVRIFMEAGTLENRMSDDNAPTLLSCHRHMRDVLLAKGYDVTYREYPGGHDYIWWRGLLADGLIALAGAQE